jgi:ABC-type antimicrobial peptide transport system permease subunit
VQQGRYNPSRTERSSEFILINCSDLTPLGEKPCEPHKTALKISIAFGGVVGAQLSDSSQEQLEIPTTELQQYPILKLLISVTGGQATVDQVRTTLESYPQYFRHSPFLTNSETHRQERDITAQIRQVLNGVFLVILFMAGSSLAVSVAGGLVERKRPFGLLRVAGASLRQLRTVVAIESAVPLLAAIVASAGLGFLVAVLLVESFASKETPALQALPTDYYIVMAVGVIIALVSLLAALPLLSAITKPENARFE